MFDARSRRRMPVAVLFTALLAACLPRAPASPVAGRPLPPAPDVSRHPGAFIAIHASPIALTHVRVIDGTGAPAADDQTVVIADGRIVAVGAASLVVVPPEAKVFDLPGHTVIPGLVGMHDHLFYPAGGELFQEMATSFPRLYLAAGVTTIRTAGSVEPYTDLEVKRRIDAGRIPGPKMHVSGPYLEGPGAYTPQMHELRDPADASRTVDFWADAGATSFKAYMHITRAELTAALVAAHARGLKVTGHLCSIGFREAAALGIDNLEHGLLADTEHYSKKIADECPSVSAARLELAKLAIASPAIQLTIRELVAHHVAVTSTLAVYEGYVPDRPPLQDRVMAALIPEAQADLLSERAHHADGSWGLIDPTTNVNLWPALFQKEMEFERAFVAAGGLLLAGSDPTGPGGNLAGFGNQREVELLVEAGFSAVEAIRIATLNGARFLAEDARIGSIAAGKQADLVVLRGDPVRSIADIEQVHLVFKDGVGFDPAKLVASVRGMVGLQ